jgi:hypothetical protein
MKSSIDEEVSSLHLNRGLLQIGGGVINLSDASIEDRAYALYASVIKWQKSLLSE